jgi:hypothetical protein
MKSKRYYADLVKLPALPPTLKKLEEMQAEVDRFESRNRMAIAREREDMVEETVLANLPTLLKAGLTPWCCDGTVCDQRTPCGQLTCPYKDVPADIIRGCSKCGSFVMCEGSSDPMTARMLLDSNLDPIER